MDEQNTDLFWLMSWCPELFSDEEEHGGQIEATDAPRNGDGAIATADQRARLNGEHDWPYVDVNAKLAVLDPDLPNELAGSLKPQLQDRAAIHHLGRKDAQFFSREPEIDEELWAEILNLFPAAPPALPYQCGELRGIKVYLVDGDEIRLRDRKDYAKSNRGDDPFMDFSYGGNGVEDPGLCRADEIYIDARTDRDNWRYTCYHEWREQLEMTKLMDGGMAGQDAYEQAHDKVNAEERVIRERVRDGATAYAREYVESEHPRVPGGEPAGGEWVSGFLAGASAKEDSGHRTPSRETSQERERRREAEDHRRHAKWEREDKILEKTREREDAAFRNKWDKEIDRQNDRLERQREREYAALSDDASGEAIEAKYEKLRKELNAKLDAEYETAFAEYLAGKEKERAAEDAEIQKRRDAEWSGILGRRDMEEGMTEQSDQYARGDYSHAQLELPEGIAFRVRQLAGAIPASAVLKSEDKPHITLLYGIKADDPEDLEEMLSIVRPIRVTLGKTSLFRTEEHDCLKIDVEGNQLLMLRAYLESGIEFEDAHEYHPHVTVAYLQPGEGPRYANDPALEGETVLVSEVCFYNREGERVVIRLGDT